MAAATFPDGTVPDPADVARVAANLYTAGPGDDGPAAQRRAADPRRPAGRPGRVAGRPHQVGNFIEEALRYESPVKGDFRLSTCPVTLAGVDVPAGSTLMVVNRARQP